MHLLQSPYPTLWRYFYSLSGSNDFGFPPPIFYAGLRQVLDPLVSVIFLYLTLLCNWLLVPWFPLWQMEIVEGSTFWCSVSWKEIQASVNGEEKMYIVGRRTHPSSNLKSKQLFFLKFISVIKLCKKCTGSLLIKISSNELRSALGLA